MQGDESAFANEVRQFLRDHWPRPPFRPPRAAAVSRWFAALCSRGWSVYAWPQAYGGAGWSLQQRFIWERAVAFARAPAMDPVGVGLVGPLVQVHGGAVLCDRYLDDIRAARSRWAAGLNGLSAEDEGLRARPRGSGYALCGTLTGIAGLDRATHALCLAAMDDGGRADYVGGGLFAVSMASASVRLVDARTLAAAEAQADLLSPPGRGLGALDAVLCTDQAPVAVTARAEAQLARMKQGLKEIGDGRGGFLDSDADVKRRLASLEVRLMALQALEARSLDHRSVSKTPDLKATLLEMGCAELTRELGELMSDTAGYYALPRPDPVLTDNEDPIGPGYALPLLEGMLKPLWAFNAHRRRLAAQLTS